MNLSELLSGVADITARPDKAQMAKNAINKACHRISIMHFFTHDRHEIQWTVDPEGALAFSIYDDIYGKDLRKIDYIQVMGSPLFLTQITPKEVFCKGRMQENVYYRTGNAIYVNLAKACTDLLLGVYKYPTILVDNIDYNWVTEMYPYVVMDGAAAMVFKSIGDDTSQARHEADFQLGCAQIMSDLKQGEL